jgi:hypothetical protein
VDEDRPAKVGDTARFAPLTDTNFGMRVFTMFDPDGSEIRVGWSPR